MFKTEQVSSRKITQSDSVGSATQAKLRSPTTGEIMFEIELATGDEFQFGDIRIAVIKKSSSRAHIGVFAPPEIRIIKAEYDSRSVDYQTDWLNSVQPVRQPLT